MHRNTTAQPTAIGLRYLADLPSIANIEFGSLSQFPSWDLGPLGHLALAPWPTCLSRSVATWSYLQHLTASYSTLLQYARCTVLSQNYPLSAISAAMLSSTLRKSSPSRISCQTNRTQQLNNDGFKKLWRSCSAHNWKDCKGKTLKLCLQGRLTQNSPRIWSYHKANFPKQIKCKTGWNNSAPNKARQFLIKWQTLCLKYNVDATKIHVVWRCLVYTLYHSMVR